MGIIQRLAVGVALPLVACLALAQKETPRTGPATEKRFPALRLPAGFTATLFACDPLVEYPSGIADGGGILRCRPDGRDLHVFSTGLRNISDVALDEELNVFVRDNENDGGKYKIRVCHSFYGADHGYPYLYDEQPDEALRPLADLGLGSSAGAVCYLESQFPAEYRGRLLFCEWGRAVVGFPLASSSSRSASTT